MEADRAETRRTPPTAEGDPPEVPIPVTLRERLRADVTAAMRSGDALRRDTLRMAQNALYNAEKRDRREYGEDEVAALLTREVKTRRESVDAFRKGGREDLAMKEEAEIAILQGYLPEPLSDAELDQLVGEAIAATGASGPKEMGKVMGWLAPRTRGRADGRRVSELVNASLATRAGRMVGGTVGDHGSTEGAG
jgi:uncharacterized protein YqeY